jgi:hypothetical protein
MTEDNNPSAPGDQGLSIGVIRAWEYLTYMGFPPPPPGGRFITPVIAIIDTGFALDTTTGVPLNSNVDYQNSFNRPRQADVINRDATAGGLGGGLARAECVRRSRRLPEKRHWLRRDRWERRKADANSVRWLVHPDSGRGAERCVERGRRDQPQLGRWMQLAVPQFRWW